MDLKITQNKSNKKEVENPYKHVKTKIFEPVYVSQDNIYSQQVDVFDVNTAIFSNMMGLFFSKNVVGNTADYPIDRTPYDKLSPILKTKGYSYQAITRAEYAAALASIMKNKSELNDYKGLDFFDSYDTAFQYKVPFVSPDIIKPYSPVIFGSWEVLTTNEFTKSMLNMYDKYTSLSTPIKEVMTFDVKYKYRGNENITKSNVSNEIIRLCGLVKSHIKEMAQEEKDSIGRFDINKDITALKTKDMEIKLYDREALVDVIKDIDKQLFLSMIGNYKYSNETPKDSLPMTIISDGKGNCNAITYFILEWITYHYPQEDYDYSITTVKMDNDKDHIALIVNNKGNLIPIDMVNGRTSSIESLNNLKIERKEKE